MRSSEDIGSTSEMRDGFGFDVGRLADYLQEAVSGFRGPLQVRQFTGGQSNPTYLLVTPDRDYVLRRKPPGQLLASAHAVDREYRVMSALGNSTRVPVPKTHALCMDDAVIGTAFYVMERVRGRIFWDTSFPEIAAPQRAAYFDAMNATLAQLHSVDPAAVGLADYGRSDGYLKRQINRWSRQYLEDTQAGRVEDLDRLIDWLGAHIPAEGRVAVIHGDFRCDNLVFDPTEPRVAAVLDWELSTLGDPLADFAYHLLMYSLPTIAFPGLAGRNLPELGIPTQEQSVAAYCRRTNRASIPDLDFYLVFNLFKSAAICHGIRGRMARGTAASARARGYAAAVEQIAAIGWARANGAQNHR